MYKGKELREKLGEILNEFKRGNNLALAKLEKLMYRFFYFMANSFYSQEADIKDAIYSFYVKLYKAIKKFKKDDNPKAWLTQVFKNFLISRQRKSKTEKKNFNKVAPLLIEEQNDDKFLDNYILLSSIRTSLTDYEWNLFYYHVVLCYSYSEIAEEYKLSKSTVGDHLKKIFIKLGKNPDDLIS